MQSWTTQASLERRVTGDRCEKKGCYELAVWLVLFNDESTHLCLKHTEAAMRDAKHWAEAFESKRKD